MRLNEAQRKNIATAISQVEKMTDAELVTVFAHRADNYYYIPTLWAALIALLLPLLIRFTPLWLDADDLFALQWILFFVFAAILRIPAIMMKLVPRQLRYQRASNLAYRQFLENNLHHTKNGMGVLVFVSEAEHYVEIIADKGISEQISNKQWQVLIDDFVKDIKAGKIEQGFLTCISNCGDLLKQYAPLSEEKNELPNRLVVLE